MAKERKKGSVIQRKKEKAPLTLAVAAVTFDSQHKHIILI